MSQFEQEVTNFYVKHKQASEKLEVADDHLAATKTDARFRGIVALRDNNAVLHQQSRDLFKKSDVMAKQQNTAERKYDENLEQAAAHKDKNFDKYVADARIDMLGQLAGEAAIVQAAEDILKSADPNQATESHTDNLTL